MELFEPVNFLAEQNLKSFCNEKYYEEAAGLSHDEIIKKYGDTPVCIAVIPENDPVFKGIWNDAKSNFVYTGLGSFIDHWVNHHPEMEAEDFLKIQNVLQNPNGRYLDKAKNAVIFDKITEDGLHDVVILKKASDKLIYERSNYLPRNIPKRWVELSNETGLEINKSVICGQTPHNQSSEKSEAGIVCNISTLDDSFSISQNSKKSISRIKSKDDDYGYGR